MIKVAGWTVAVLAVVVITGQPAMAGRRRSVRAENKIEIEGVIKTPGTTSLVVTTSHKDDVMVSLTDKTVIRHGDSSVAAADLKASDRVHVKPAQSNGVTTAMECEVQNENEPEY